MKHVTVAEFCDRHGACFAGRAWAASNCVDMADVWRRLCAGEGHIGWLVWVLSRPGVLTRRQRARLAARFAAETPLADGRTTWDLLTDERSREAIRMARRYASGRATRAHLDAASAAWDAAWGAWVAAYDARGDAWAARDAARDAQRRMVAELPNPFEPNINGKGN
jgi:hypothetical protein